ncbi:hypothetical protein K493DRAFT_341855 [Basidiobolus meristosporus CBS 931.73]|uniref:Protein EFR3 n=1 Tax=Basidiobolus meristosporus CBS 931.73 TaxID=1314790 RepID=A0A1Y1XGV5_9FUNG|nr:hypothetical protein K493DRAFT_341855 [Basidiobolus meristosporus CBS 931.73]|eukprot:ORX84981.1 hypothetical protein K493DRAFT_341855 [Basidiobolus meristosporus CBS 931.73]
MTWAAGNTFRKFCSKYDGTSLGVNQELTNEFDALVNSFCALAAQDSGKEAESKWYFVGLRAIYGLVISNVIKTTHAKSYLRKIIYSSLSNINSFEEYLSDERPDTLNYLGEDVPCNKADVGGDLLNTISLECAKQLIQNSSPLYFPIITETFFGYVKDNNLYENQDYCIDLAHFIMLNVSPSYRHIIVNEILKMLEHCEEIEVDQKKATLMNVIAFCLNHRMAALGLSVLEVVNTLIKHLFKLLQYKNLTMRNPHSEEFTPLESEFRKGIVQSIGGLATHLYYSEQINDTLQFLINKLSIGCSEKEVDGVPISAIRRALLKCMRIMVDINAEAVKKSRYDHSEIPFEMITPTLCLFANEHPSVRKEYGFFFLSCLDNSDIGRSNATSIKSSISSTKHVHRTSDRTLKFRASLHEALYKYALKDSLFPLDYSIILSIFKKLIQRYQHEELIRAIPVMFKLQEIADSLEHPHALDQLVASYFEYVAKTLEMPALEEYISEVIKTRKQVRCWYNPRDCNIEDLRDLEGKTFAMLTEKPTMSEHSRRVNIDPEVIRKIVADDELSQRQFSDLQRRLNLEYDPEGSSSGLQYSSANLSPGVTGAKVHPKLSTPLIIRPQQTNEPTKPPKVENLLEALKSGNDDSSDFLDSDSSDVLREGSVNSGTKKSEKLKPDVANLLKSISVSSFTNPNSLVNTPHFHS